MKKVSLICMCVLAAMLLAVGVCAEPAVYEPDAAGAFDVTYTGTPGAYYALVAVEGIAEEGTAPVITETSIQFIDQVTASASGAVAFDGVLLKNDGTPCTLYLGGSDLESALLLGYVNKDGKADEFVVSGTVTSDSAKEAQVTLTGAKTFTVETVNGSYTVSVPADTYKFVVSKAAHLSYTKNEMVVDADVAKDVTLKGGDVNEDDVINFVDLGEVVAAYNSESENCDISGDGIVNYVDLAAVIANYNLESFVE